MLHDVLHESNGLIIYPVQLFRIIEQVMKHNFEKKKQVKDKATYAMFIDQLNI